MRMIISFSVMCLLLWLTFREGELTSPEVGKTKLSHAPQQSASLIHIAPRRELTLDMLTVSAIKEQTLKELGSTSATSSAPTSTLTPRGQQTPSQSGDVGSGSGSITGSLDISKDMRAQFKQGSTLFLIVRGVGSQGGQGPLIASAKHSSLTLADFPLTYVITQQNSMMGSPLVGEVQVSARLDQDGDALSKQPGDLVGRASSTTTVGKNPVNFTLDSAL